MGKWEENEKKWREEFPRHAWALDQMKNVRPVYISYIEAIRATGKLGDRFMNCLWDRADALEKKARRDHPIIVPSSA